MDEEAVPAEAVAEPEKEPEGSPWLTNMKDEDLLEEDVERNKEQASRNLRMRDKLKLARERKQAAEPEAKGADFEEFMGVTKAAPKAAIDEHMPPWFEARPHIENTVLRLHEELLDFVVFMQHSPEEVEARRDWVRTIGNACRSLWPSCEVRVFGSFFTGLSLPNGDVDIAILDVPCRPATAMKILADKMLAQGEISWLEIIESAKVPVAKLRSQSYGLRADVVFNQPDGIKTSQFIRERCKEYPQLRHLLIFLKYFLLQRGLHETYGGGMGSYLLCNVCLHFLQRHPSRRDQRQYAATSLGHLLFDFLKYYGQEFRYDSQGISLINGGNVFNKADMAKGKAGGKGKDKGKLSLCLRSPLDPSVDLGGACFRMTVLRNLFNHGYHCLCHLFVTRAPAEASLLCPLLLDPAHAVITTRHNLMVEQPVALPGLKQQMDAEAVEADAPPAKRQKTANGNDFADAFGDEVDGFVALGASGGGEEVA